MFDADTLEALEAILRSDPRPWRRLTTERSAEVAELHFPKREHAAARDLAAEAQQLGFDVDVQEKGVLRESATSGAADLLLLLIHHGGSAAGFLIGASALVKAANELPENLRKLRDKLKPYFSRAAVLSPDLQLDAIHRWLDEKYGPKKWRYDPDKVEIKQIANVAVYHFREEISNTVHLLAVKDDDVRELPLNWLPEAKE